MEEIKPTKYIENLKPYKNSSHKVWDHIYHQKKDSLDEVIKLDWNEASSLPKNLTNKIFNYILSHEIRLNWYPDVDNVLLVKKISEYNKVSFKKIQYFNGSDSALEYITRTYLQPDSRVVICSPAYDNFRVYVQECGAKPIFYFNENPFKKNKESLKKKLASEKPTLVYLVNPNNPTGLLYSKKEIEDIISEYKNILFVIDEAYVEFCGFSCGDLVEKYKNIVVAKTFTKAFGLGAFRLGYILADESIIENINRIRVGKGINTFAQIAGILALENKDYMEKYVREVNESKEIVIRKFSSWGVDAIKTSANFILVKCNNPSETVKVLEKNNIFIRDVSHMAQLEKYVRITVGDKKTTRKFLQRVESIIKKDESSIF